MQITERKLCKEPQLVFSLADPDKEWWGIPMESGLSALQRGQARRNSAEAAFPTLSGRRRMPVPP